MNGAGQNPHDGPPIVIMPSMNLACFILLERHLTWAGYRIVMSLRFPKRSILSGRKIMALHLHQLDSVFRGQSARATAWRIWWFRLVLVPALKLRHIPLIWTCHELAAHENDPLAITGRMARVMARRADRIIVHNQGMRERLAAFEPRSRSRIVLIPHGDLREFYEPFLADMPPRSSEGGAVFAFRDCPTSGSVITAMALERAVIGPAIGHVRELVDDESGWLFDPADFENGLLGAMRSASERPDMATLKGRAGRERIARDDWTGIAANMATVYGPAPRHQSVGASQSAGPAV